MALLDPERLDGRPVVVKYSGGKDSSAVVCALLDEGIRPAVLLYCDTGWEESEHYPYMDRMREWWQAHHGLQVVTVAAQISLPPERVEIAERIEALAGLPGPSAMIRRALKYACLSRPGRGAGGGKWCTAELKQIPAAVWLEDWEGPDPVIVTGVRREESRARADTRSWEMQTRSPHLWEWRPIAHWTVLQVGATLQRHAVPVHPLYDRGAARVGCWPCIHVGKAELRLIGQDERRMAAVTALEQAVTELSASRHPVGWLQAKSETTPGGGVSSCPDQAGRRVGTHHSRWAATRADPASARRRLRALGVV